MTCQRCRGYCAMEDVIDEGEHIVVARCLNCGALSDPLIEQHHQMTTSAPAHRRIVRVPGHVQVTR